jgi:hypothetical protein
MCAARFGRRRSARGTQQLLERGAGNASIGIVEVPSTQPAARERRRDVEAKTRERVGHDAGFSAGSVVSDASVARGVNRLAPSVIVSRAGSAA